MSRWLGLLLLLLGACAPTDEPLAEPDPGLAELAIVEVAPTTLFAGVATGDSGALAARDRRMGRFDYG